MAYRKADVKLIEAMTNEDKLVLQAVYYHRCLNEDLMYEFFYKQKNISRGYAARRVRWLCSHDLLRPVEYGEDFPALFLTTFGIETYRYIYEIPKEIYDIETGKTKRTLRLSKELLMKPNNLRHQIALNRFALEFDSLAKDSFEYVYQDEKFVDLYTTIRPDGLISMQNADLFLEMDMASERKEALLSKWNHYRAFLKSKEYREKGKKMVMVFIINNVKDVERRRSLVLSTMQLGLMDLLDNCFEVYVDTPQNLMKVIFEKLTPESITEQEKLQALSGCLATQHCLLSSPAKFVNKILPETTFLSYTRKLNHEKKILIDDGRPQEFLLDVYWDRPISVLNKILNYNRMSAEMMRSLHRRIPYLVVASDERELYYDLKVIQAVDCSNIYFTTYERLQRSTFPEALFQFNSLGDISHFVDFGLQKRVYERSIK